MVTGADFLAIFWATSCFLGTFCAVDFLAVCLVLAIYIILSLTMKIGFKFVIIGISNMVILIG